MSVLRAQRLLAGASLLAAASACLAGTHSMPGETTPLHDAARAGDVEALRALVRSGGDVNARDAYGCTPLHVAAAGGRAEALGALLDLDARIDALAEYHMTALHWAAVSGDEHATRLLLAHGARADSRDMFGMTPLHLAGSAGAVRALLQGGALLGALDDDGMTPLHLAHTEGSSRALTDAGSDVLARAHDGRRPIDMIVVRSDTPAPILLYPGGPRVRLRGEEARFGMALRSLSREPVPELGAKAASDTLEVALAPVPARTLRPGQRTRLELLVRRRPGPAPEAQYVRLEITSGAQPILTTVLNVDARRERTFEDQGLIKLGQIGVASESKAAHWAAYLAAPGVLLLGYALVRLARRRAARVSHTASAAARPIASGNDSQKP